MKRKERKRRFTVRFTLDVDVHNPSAVKRLAEARAVEEGVSLTDWRKSRRGTGDDLIMLLDPGESPEGTSILGSSADEGDLS
jgi:hypothetical protein